jgi:hypothetical protein
MRTSRQRAGVPESAGAASSGRSYAVVARVELESADAEGALYAETGGSDEPATGKRRIRTTGPIRFPR